MLLLLISLLGALSVVYVLVRGVFTMASDKADSNARSDRLMIARVSLQGLTILAVVALFFLSGHLNS